MNKNYSRCLCTPGPDCPSFAPFCITNTQCFIRVFINFPDNIFHGCFENFSVTHRSLCEERHDSYWFGCCSDRIFPLCNQRLSYTPVASRRAINTLSIDNTDEWLSPVLILIAVFLLVLFILTVIILVWISKNKNVSFFKRKCMLSSDRTEMSPGNSLVTVFNKFSLNNEIKNKNTEDQVTHLLNFAKSNELSIIKPSASQIHSAAQLPDVTVASSGSGSGPLFLVPRTVARQIVLEQCIGKGRFGEVWRGRLHEDPVAVKVFSSREEASWSCETDIYNTCLLRHPHILFYYASDVTSQQACTQLWIVTEYHANGSLYDFLLAETEGGRGLTVSQALRLCWSAANGLAHLHTRVFGLQAKPSIVHRDVKSKNILVKSNGECCLADLGLAMLDPSDRAFQAQLAASCSGISGPQSSLLLKTGGESDSPGAALAAQPRVGTKRYMSPEVLAAILRDIQASGNCAEPPHQLDFAGYLASDVYSLGLVLWEVANVCMCGVYQLPYWDCVDADPAYEAMHQVVCDLGKRPRLAATPGESEEDESGTLGRLKAVISGSWQSEPANRLDSRTIQQTLLQLLNREVT